MPHRLVVACAHQALAHFDHAKRRPLLANTCCDCLACAQSDGSDGLNEADTADAAAGTMSASGRPRRARAPAGRERPLVASG